MDGEISKYEKFVEENSKKPEFVYFWMVFLLQFNKDRIIRALEKDKDSCRDVAFLREIFCIEDDVIFDFDSYKKFAELLIKSIKKQEKIEFKFFNRKNCKKAIKNSQENKILLINIIKEIKEKLPLIENFEKHSCFNSFMVFGTFFSRFEKNEFVFFINFIKRIVENKSKIKEVLGEKWNEIDKAFGFLESFDKIMLKFFVKYV